MAGNLSLSLIINAIDRATAPMRRITDNFKLIREAKLKAEEGTKFAANLNLAAQGASMFASKIKGVLAPLAEGAMGFDEAMARVRMHTEASTAEMKNLEDSLIGVNSVIGENKPTEAARAMAVMAKEGLGVKDIMTALPTVLRLSQVGQMDLGAAAMETTSLLSAWKMSAGDATVVGDILAGATKGTKLSVGELSGALRENAAEAQQAGASMAVVAMLTKTMAKAGVDAGSSMMILKRAMLNLGGAASGDALKVIEHFFGPGGKRKTGDFIADLALLKKGIEKLPKESQTKALEALFGMREVGGARALFKNLDLPKTAAEIAALVGKLKKQDEALANSKRTAEELGSQIDQLKNSLGTELLPAIGALINGYIIPAVQWIKAWAQEHPTLIKIILLGGAAVGILATALAGLLWTMSTVVSGLAAFKVAMAAVQTTKLVMSLIPLKTALFGTAAGAGAVTASIALTVVALAAAVWAVSRWIKVYQQYKDLTPAKKEIDENERVLAAKRLELQKRGLLGPTWTGMVPEVGAPVPSLPGGAGNTRTDINITFDDKGRPVVASADTKGPASINIGTGFVMEGVYP